MVKRKTLLRQAILTPRSLYSGELLYYRGKGKQGGQKRTRNEKESKKAKLESKCRKEERKKPTKKERKGRNKVSKKETK